MLRIRVEGAQGVLARLGRLPATAQREVEEVLAGVAGVNATKIRAAAGRAGRQAAKASASVSASGNTISGGGPFFMGSMFGGQGRPTTQQFKPYRGGDGYWFFTTLSEAYPETVDRFSAVIDAIAREWGG